MVRKANTKVAESAPAEPAETLTEAAQGIPESRRERGGPRLSHDERVEIRAALVHGERPAVLAERYNVSLGAIYAYRKATLAPASDPEPHQESDLHARLVTYAMRKLLGRPIPETEEKALEREVQDELDKRIASGKWKL
jgi:hypothetical protein